MRTVRRHPHGLRDALLFAIALTALWLMLSLTSCGTHGPPYDATTDAADDIATRPKLFAPSGPIPLPPPLAPKRNARFTRV